MKRAFLVPPLIGLLTGFLVSFLFTPRYTSQATLLVKSPVPSHYLVLSSTIIDEVGSLTELALSATSMSPAVQSLHLVEPGQLEDQTLQDIRRHVTVIPTKLPNWLVAPTFYVKYTDNEPLRAQKICQMLTDLIVDQTLRIREQRSSGTYEFLERQLGKL